MPFYQNGWSHLPWAILFLSSVLLVWAMSRYGFDEMYTRRMMLLLKGQMSGPRQGSGDISDPLFSLIFQDVTKTKAARIWSDKQPRKTFLSLKLKYFRVKEEESDRHGKCFPQAQKLDLKCLLDVAIEKYLYSFLMWYHHKPVIKFMSVHLVALWSTAKFLFFKESILFFIPDQTGEKQNRWNAPIEFNDRVKRQSAKDEIIYFMQYLTPFGTCCRLQTISVHFSTDQVP